MTQPPTDVSHGALLATLRQATDLLARRETATAEALLAQALETSPNQPDLIQLLGNACVQAGKLGDAEILYRRSLALEPKQADVATNLGHVLRIQRRHLEAIEVFRAAIAIKSDHVDAYQGLAITFQHLGQPEEALVNFNTALAIYPGNAAMLNSRGILLGDLHRPEDALASFDMALAIKPNLAEALTNRGVTLQHLKRFDEALASFDRALALNPDLAQALINRGVTLQSLQRFEEALPNYDRALALKPDYAEAWNNRGIALQHLKRLEDALASYDKALALNPGYAEAWNNRGIALQLLKRFEEARASHAKALILKPEYAGAWSHHGVALQRLNLFEDALTSFNNALAINPDDAGALQNLGLLLCESNRVEEGLTVLTRHATLVHRTNASPAHGNALNPPHKVRHDQEQRDYLAGGRARDDDPSIDARFHLGDGGRLATAAINPGNTASDVGARWQQAHPQIIVIDNFLTDEALKKLRLFCHDSTVWRRIYDGGYLGATPEDGFACPLLAQIADELRAAFPAVFGAHPLCYLWGFKYDSRLKGTNLHADGAVVNVNFWITPDEANLDPEIGGLIVWDVAAPLDWDFAEYNANRSANRDFLARTGARPVTIPYRANRAVIFDSDLFHETDRIAFQEGYLNRRINVTLLYGRRPISDG